MKGILLKTSLIIFGIFLGIIVCEVTLRILSAVHLTRIDEKKSFANDPFLYSATLKYRIKPYFTRNCTAPGNPSAICYANYYGFRDKDYSFQKPDDVYRIVLIGDSLTYGPGVNNEDTYPRLFEKIVNKNNPTKKKIEVLNLGMIFYGPQQYYYLYKEIGEKYNADLVVMSYHLLTDPYDAYEYDQNRQFYFYKSAPDMLPYTINQFLKEHSYLYRTLLSGYYHWANKQEVNVAGNVFHGQKNRYQYDTQLFVTSPAMKKGWELSEVFVNDFVNVVKRNKSKVAIIIFPNRAQIIPDDWKVIQKNGEVSDSKLYSDSATRKEMNYLCMRHHWSCLDLQDALRNTTDPEKLFLKGDIHLTRDGNIIAANSLFNYLKSNKIIF